MPFSFFLVFFLFGIQKRLTTRIYISYTFFFSENCPFLFFMFFFCSVFKKGLQLRLDRFYGCDFVNEAGLSSLTNGL